jgi:hypothetical protein
MQAELPRRYRLARQSASVSMRAHGEHAVADALPETCRYAPEQTTGDWLP